jgi:hypothetical protein
MLPSIVTSALVVSACQAQNPSLGSSVDGRIGIKTIRQMDSSRRGGEFIGQICRNTGVVPTNRRLGGLLCMQLDTLLELLLVDRSCRRCRAVKRGRSGGGPQEARRTTTMMKACSSPIFE